jgi:hypothetical protein
MPGDLGRDHGGAHAASASITGLGARQRAGAGVSRHRITPPVRVSLRVSTGADCGGRW